MKKRILVSIMFLFIALFSFAFLAPAQVVDAAEDEVILIYAKTPEGWDAPNVWTWDADGNSAFGFLGWPGKPMIKDEGNDGWYYLYIPSSMTNVIVNGTKGESTVQTDGVEVSGNSWITITEGVDGEGKPIVNSVVSTTKETTGELPAYVATLYVFALVPIDWDETALWAWEGTNNLYEAWPGEEMDLLSDGWFMKEIPAAMEKIIVNNNVFADGFQTADITLDGNNIYVVVDDELVEGKNKHETFKEKPVIIEDGFRVTVKVPASWETPHVWAWSHPDGTNVYPTWPGEPLSYDEEKEEYYIILPGWINKIIINNGPDSEQTVDIDVEKTEDCTLTIGDLNTEGKRVGTITYGDIPIDPVDPVDEDPDGLPGWAIALIVVGGVLVLGGVAAFILIKRKK